MYSVPDLRPPREKAAGSATGGGYPVDSDLHQMSDDGRPNSPDPARWADPDWRDNLGEWDTFDEAGSADGRPLAVCPDPLI
jgi:hypothetical protein